MKYVDGFVLPVPEKNIQAYRRIAAKAGKIWREHGALEYRECVGDDVKMEKLTSFQAQARRDGGVLVDRVQVARASRSRQRQGDEGPAHHGDGQFGGHALRCEAHGLRRIQGPGQPVAPRPWGLASIERREYYAIHAHVLLQ